MLYVWIDNSSSTCCNNQYWKKVSDIVDKVHHAGDITPSYFLWNTYCHTTTYPDIVRRQVGTEGLTRIQVIAQNTIDHAKDDSLLIITDGQVDASDVKECKTIIADEHETREWKKVIVYILDDDEHINFSVCAPFLKGNPFEIHGYNKTVIQKSNSDPPNPLLSRGYGSNPQLFLDQFESIKTEIFVENMGSNDTHEIRDSILQLQKEMIAALINDSALSNEEKLTLSQQMDKFVQEWRDIVYNSEIHHEYAIELFKKNIPGLFPYTKTDKDDDPLHVAEQVSIRVKELVDMCDTSLKGFAMDPHSKLERARLVDEEDIDDVPATAIGEWECPITCEDHEVMCILIPTNSKNLLKDLPRKQFKKLATWPELLDVIIPMEAKQPIGLETCKQLLKRIPFGASPISPFTREPVDRAFVLYTGDDVNIARKVHALNDFVLLSCLFDGGKIVGQIDILFCAMFLKNAVHICNEVGFQFREYLQKRLKMRKTNITLSGLPIPPLVRVPIDLALWYCANTEEILDENGPFVTTNANRYREAFRQNKQVVFIRMRILGGIMCMNERALMLKTIRFDFAAELTESLRIRKTQKHAPISRILCNVLAADHIYRREDDVFFETKQAHWMVQSLFFVGDIMALLDRGKRITELDLKNIYPPFRIPYYDRPPVNTSNIRVESVPICTETCRPYYDAEKMKNLRSGLVSDIPKWKPEVLSTHRYLAEWLISDRASYDELVSIWTELKQILTNRQHIMRTNKGNIFLTDKSWNKEHDLVIRETAIKKKFAKFAHAKQWKKGIPVLPYNFEELAASALHDYGKCMHSFSHDEFKKRYNSTYDLEKRKLAEQREVKSTEASVDDTARKTRNPFAVWEADDEENETIQNPQLS